jgi:hypothetical protein
MVNNDAHHWGKAPRPVFRSKAYRKFLTHDLYEDTGLIINKCIMIISIAINHGKILKQTRLKVSRGP